MTAAFIAASILVLALICVGLFWKGREKRLGAFAKRIDAAFYKQGSSDTEVRFSTDEHGKVKLETGAEYPPLAWRELECFPLFDPRTTPRVFSPT